LPVVTGVGRPAVKGGMGILAHGRKSLDAAFRA
jgi:hypothetical protein